MLRSYEQRNSGLVNKKNKSIRGTELQEVEEGRRREMDVGLDNSVKVSMHDPDRNFS